MKIIENQNKTSPDKLAIKLVITGYQFSGKKTIADYLHKKYGIQVLQIEKVVNDLLSRLKNEDAASEDTELKLARQIQQLLIEGENISDELYMEALTLKLRELFPAQTDDQFLDEYQHIQTSQDDLQKMIELSKITET